MIVRWINDLAGVKAGVIKTLPDDLANRLVAKGVVEAVRIAPKTPVNTKAGQVIAQAVKAAKTSRKSAKKTSK